jgi:acetoin:2,6-dichlorophenolindophenol oxidoreductase subunit beta
MRGTLTFSQAIGEAIEDCMSRDDGVFVVGEGVPDPKGIFGTTAGLREKFGSQRVMDMPLSENAMTGACIGTALSGMRPILVHQRADFALLSMDQIINNAAKWHYMFNGLAKVPIVIRMMIGRGWGQGPQHSLSPQSMFAGFPGLKVVLPMSPYDAKGMLIQAVEDDGPVIFLEHRWVHHLKGAVPEETYREPLGKARIVQEGADLTLAGFSYSTVEAAMVAKAFKEQGIHIEVLDMRSARPLDYETLLKSVRKTKRVIFLDTGWVTCGISAELSAHVSEKAFGCLKEPPVRLGLPDIPTPTSPSLAEKLYPGPDTIGREVLKMLKINIDDKWNKVLVDLKGKGPYDVPYIDFEGPF